ncbi:MAG TPA: PEP-CTERM sorting domain-containing protein [Pirellulales bacterium]|nr:PEP-CTERM sorting domain-containing protein [Pirellulales bacterium]
MNTLHSSATRKHVQLAFNSCLLALCAATSTAAATVWNESINGDLSNDRLAPTAIAVAVGSNDVIGSVVGNPSDLDYFTINVPTGDELSQLVLESFTSTDQRGFIGVQHGTTFTESASAPNVANLLGWTHFGPGAGNVGLDILPGMGQGPGAQGFTAPLAAGSYTFWVQQLGALTNYDFNFVVKATPEPATWGMALVAAGFCVLGAAHRRMTSS